MRVLKEVQEGTEILEDATVPGWRLRFELWRSETGALVIERLTVEPKYEHLLITAGSSDAASVRAILGWRKRRVPGAGVTARLLRALKLREATDYGRRVVRAGHWDVDLPPAPTPTVSKSRKRRGGRPRARGDQDDQRIAQRYQALAAAGVKAVNVALAREWGVSTSAMTARVYRCRRSGLLPATSRGVASRAADRPDLAASVPLAKSPSKTKKPRNKRGS